MKNPHLYGWASLNMVYLKLLFKEDIMLRKPHAIPEAMREIREDENITMQ